MPYASNDDLPERIQRRLPQHAQSIYREAFNHAYRAYGPALERVAHRVAWSAVKRKYQKVEGEWIRRGITALTP